MLQKFFFDSSKGIPKSHKLHKILKRNAVEVSYSCMENISKIYKGHKSKITSTPCNQLTLCYCRVKEECSMDNKCHIMGAFYDCRVTLSKPRKIYFRLAERKWKNRYYNYKNSFKHK